MWLPRHYGPIMKQKDTTKNDLNVPGPHKRFFQRTGKIQPSRGDSDFSWQWMGGDRIRKDIVNKNNLYTCTYKKAIYTQAQDVQPNLSLDSSVQLLLPVEEGGESFSKE